MPETLNDILKRLINNGMTRFNGEKIYSEAINSLDIDCYSLDEIKDLFKKLLNEKKAAK